MKLRHLLAAASAAILGLSAIPATATVVTFSKLSNFRVELIDLTPNDGVAPSISFEGLYNSASVRYSQYWLGPTTGYESYFDIGGKQITLALPGTQGTSNVNGYELATSVELEDGMLTADASFIQNFTLSANTRAVFSIDMQSQATFNFPQGAYSYGALNLHVNETDENLAMLHDPMSSELDQFLLSLSLEAGAADLTGYVYAGSTSSAYNAASQEPAADVPVPGTTALLLVGLAGVAVARRRHRAARSS